MTLGIPPEILRLTAYDYPPLSPDRMGSAERRSPICGSRVVVDVDLDAAGRVASFGMRVNACAFGQAASALLAGNLRDRTPAELRSARERLGAWMAGAGDAPDWPDIAHLAPERLNAVRRASVQLAFEAAAAAAEAAAQAVRTKGG